MNESKVSIKIGVDVNNAESIAALRAQLLDAAKVMDGPLKQAALDAAQELDKIGQQEKAISYWREMNAAATSSAGQLRAAQRELKNYRDQLGHNALATQAQADALVRLKTALSSAQETHRQNTGALQQARAALTDWGISTRDVAQAQERLRTQVGQVREKVQSLDPAWQSASASASAAGQGMTRTHRQISEGVDSISVQLQALRNVYMAVQGVQGTMTMAKDLAATADAANNLQSRLKLVTGEGQQFASAWQGVQDVALRTHSSLENTSTLFSRIAQTGKDAGLSTQAAVEQSLRLTETINQAVQISGASVQASSAAVTQLIQGLQSGVLRGEEFNSVMEQAPRLARALADGLKVTTGELRKMAESGALTTDVVIKALKSQSDTLRSEFAQLAPTVGRALQDLSTQWTLYVNEVDKSHGASAAAAKAIKAVSDNLHTVGNLLMGAGQAMSAFIALGAAQHFYSLATASAKAAFEVKTLGAVTETTAATLSKAEKAGKAFASVMAGLKGFALLSIVTNFKDIGTWIGQATARALGYRDGTEAIAKAEKEAAEATRQRTAQQQSMARAAQEQTDRQNALSRAVANGVSEFDKLTKEGSAAAQAIKKITDGFDLSKTQGIKDFTATLDHLGATGRASAKDVQEAWAAALKGEDLGAWEVRVRQAFAFAKQDAEKAAKAVEEALEKGIQGKALDDLREKAQLAAAEVAKAGQRMQQALDAGTREAIRRSGQDWDVLAGKIGAASRSAINDVEAIAAALPRLKAEGIDTGRALTASISQAIKTADSQAAIDALKDKINDLRGELGEKIADGLLDQAKKRAEELGDALDKATPGINSVREAFKELGIKSDAELKELAARAKEAFETVRNSGTASPREVNAAWKKMAEAAIEANDGVADATIKAQAASHGFAIETDSAGKSAVKSLSKTKDAAKGVGDEMSNTGEKARDALGNIDYGAQMAGKSMEELEKITRKNWDAQRDLSDQAAEHNAAANELGNAWMKQQQEQNKYYGEMVKMLQKTRMGFDDLNKQAWAAANALEALDKQQKALEQSSGGAADGLQELKSRLADLDGDEANRAQRSAEREKAQVQRQMALMALDLQRAQIRKDSDEVRRLQSEIAAYQEQLQLLDAVAEKEEALRKRKARQERNAAQEQAREERSQSQQTHSEAMGHIGTESQAKQAAQDAIAAKEQALQAEVKKRYEAEDKARAAAREAEDKARAQAQADEDKAATARYAVARKALDDEEQARQAALRAEAQIRAEARAKEDERRNVAEAARVAREKANSDAAAKAAEAAEKQRAAREANAASSRSAEDKAAMARQRDAVLTAQKAQAQEQTRLEAERAAAAAQARAKHLQDERSAEDKAAAERERLVNEAHQARLQEIEQAERERQERVQAEREREAARLAQQRAVEDARTAEARAREEALLKGMQDVAAALLTGAVLGQAGAAGTPALLQQVQQMMGVGSAGLNHASDTTGGVGGGGSSTGITKGAGGTAYVSNITIPGLGKAENVAFKDPSSQAKVTDLLRQLASARGAAQ